MDKNQLNEKVAQTLASLDDISPCMPSGGFLERVVSSASDSNKGSEVMDWWANLAITMVIMILLLDVAALVSKGKLNDSEVQSQILREISFESQDTPSPFSIAELDKKSGGF